MTRTAVLSQIRYLLVIVACWTVIATAPSEAAAPDTVHSKAGVQVETSAKVDPPPPSGMSELLTWLSALLDQLWSSRPAEPTKEPSPDPARPKPGAPTDPAKGATPRMAQAKPVALVQPTHAVPPPITQPRAAASAGISTMDDRPARLARVEPTKAMPDHAPQPMSSASAALTTIRGLVKPTSRATFTSQIEARITHLPFREGQQFTKGTPLVTLDCAKHHAELHAALAEQQARLKTLDTHLKLLNLSSISALEVEVSKAEAEKAAAAVDVTRVAVRGCRIDAPFNGRVVSVFVNEHERVFPNDKLLTILDDSRLEIELILPSHTLAWLKTGSSFHFVVDETGHTYTAHMTRIGASVDPVSQTVQIVGEFSGPPKDVLAGMSGTASFPEQRP